MDSKTKFLKLNAVSLHAITQNKDKQNMKRSSGNSFQTHAVFTGNKRHRQEGSERAVDPLLVPYARIDDGSFVTPDEWTCVSEEVRKCNKTLKCACGDDVCHKAGMKKKAHFCHHNRRVS